MFTPTPHTPFQSLVCKREVHLKERREVAVATLRQPERRRGDGPRGGSVTSGARAATRLARGASPALTCIAERHDPECLKAVLLKDPGVL